MNDVNSTIAIVHRLDYESHSGDYIISEGKHLAEKISRLKENAAKSNAHIQFTTVDNMTEALTEGRRIDKNRFVKELGNIARQASNDYYSGKNKIANIGLFVLLLNIVISCVALATVFRVKNIASTFHKNIMHGIQSISNLINYNKEHIQISSRWQEEEEVFKLVNNISTQIRTDRELSEISFYGNLDLYLSNLFKIIEGLDIPCDRVALAFLDQFQNIIAESAETRLNKMFLDPGFIEHINDTTLGKIASSFEPRIINDLKNHYDNVNKSEATAKILAEGLRSNLTLPIVINGKCFGFLFISSRKTGVYTGEHVTKAGKILNSLKLTIYYHYIIQEVISKTTNAFVKLMEKKDNETAYHIVRMSLYSHILAKKVFEKDKTIKPVFVREILWFAPLHDIGKIGIPDSILLKPGQLNKDEFDQMREHVDIGIDIFTTMNKSLFEVLNTNLLNTAIDIISAHHEQYDGSGYPKGLRDGDIPLAGRITAVADVFDALTSKRPYKDAYSIEKSMTILKEGKGTKFDPHLIDLFEEALPEITKVYDKYKEV